MALTNGMYVGGGRYGQGAYTLDGGQLTVSGGLGIGALGTGTFLQTAGTVTVSGNIGLGSMSGGNASYTLTGNTGSLSAGGITIGSATGPAVFTVNGGSLNVAAGGSFVVGASSSGTFTQNGGVVTLAQGGFLSLGSGLIGASNFNLNGGTLTVGRVGVGSGVFSSSTTTLSFNGGTLRANAASTTFVSGLTSAYVRASGAKIDSNGYTITIPQALVHDPALAGNARDGGLTKLGTGNLILSGTNTYNGGTLIAGGSLEAAVNGALGTGNVMLGPGAFTLTLDASVGDAIANTASLSLDSTVGGKLQLRGAAGGIQETVGALDINGVSQSAGTYGATGSGAQYIDDAHFAGTGVLAVTGFRGAEFSVLAGAVPEPGTGVLAGAGILLAAAWRRRRAGRAANVKHAGTTRA